MQAMVISMEYKIYVDVMGGDNAPLAGIDGALDALKLYPNIKVVLAGTKEALEGPLKEREYDASRVEVLYKEQVVADDEHNPAQAVRSLKDSSLMYGLRILKEKQVDALISASNTGAVLSGATLLTGRIRGIQRPALPIGLPTPGGDVWMLDIGANMDSKAVWLVQYAKMMTIFLQCKDHNQRPTVGLLNVGVEPGKGNALMKETYDLLKADPTINFIGNVESREVMNHAADIIVTDGFAGNVYLKCVEGTATYILKYIKNGIAKSLTGKIGALLLKPILKSLKDQLDPNKVGGSMMIGINGVVFKAHGNSKAEEFTSSIREALKALDSNYIAQIQKALEDEKNAEKND